MPYIKQIDRKKFENAKKLSPRNAGELNYLITIICHQYIANNGENYQNYNDIVGALEGSKLELYRRLVSVYEDKKVKENGDV